MSECLFCRIARGDLPAQKVYEDDAVLAFLDINPLVHGHILVIPKEHAARIGDLSADTAAAFFRVVPRLAAAVEKGAGAGGLTAAFNDGEAAGQEVAHVHLHLVPRTSDDGFGSLHTLFGGPNVEAGDKLEEAREAIVQALS